MHRYRQIEVRCGAALEVIKCHPRGMRKGVGREPVQKSPEEIQKANMKQAAKRLARLINANFRPGDVHVTLTYRKAGSARSAEEPGRFPESNEEEVPESREGAAVDRCYRI